MSQALLSADDILQALGINYSSLSKVTRAKFIVLLHDAALNLVRLSNHSVNTQITDSVSDLLSLPSTSTLISDLRSDLRLFLFYIV